MKDLKGRALADWIIIRAVKAEEKSSGGIIIPDISKEKPGRGIVVAAGPGKPGDPCQVKAGDHVLYDKKSGAEIEIEGEKYLYMREYPNIIFVI